MKLTTVFSLSAVVLAAACGGGGGSGGGGGGGIDPTIPSFANAAAVIADGETSLEAITPLGLTTPSGFQRSGSATFDGTVVINDATTGASNASVLGGMTVTVDFADEDNVTGKAGNFFDLANSRVGGSLTLDNVEFSEGVTGGGFIGDLTGRLTSVGRTGSDQSFDYNLDAAALYYGSGVQAIIGLVDGSATAVGTSTPRDITGAATLERE